MSFCANAGRTTSGATRVRLPAPVSGVVYVLPSLSHCFLQRMLAELQPSTLGVAGSNPAGRKAVAQRQSTTVSPTLVAAFCFEVNADGTTGRRMQLRLHTRRAAVRARCPGSSPGPGTDGGIKRFIAPRHLFFKGRAGIEGSATAKNVVLPAVRVAPDAAGKPVGVATSDR